jgi:hypothetical protein
MKDLPDNKEMYLYAQRNLEFLLKLLSALHPRYRNLTNPSSA